MLVDSYPKCINFWISLCWYCVDMKEKTCLNIEVRIIVKMTEEHVLSELRKLNYPTEEDGWIKRPQNGLPPYRTLRKNLIAQGIEPKLTWDKEQMMQEIRTHQPVADRFFEDQTSDSLYTALRKIMNEQNRLFRNIAANSSAILPNIKDDYEKKEELLIKRQLDMMPT